MPRLIYTVLSHRYEAHHHDNNPWDENEMQVISHHVSLRAANLEIIDTFELDGRDDNFDYDLDRDLAGESEEIDNEGDDGYIRHEGGRLDVMRSNDANNGHRMRVVARPLDEHVQNYGDLKDEDEDEDEGADEDGDTPALEPSLKRSAPSHDDDIEYMGTKKVKGP